MERIRFGLVSTGWRSQFFARAAVACSEWFELTGVTGRDPNKAAALAERCQAPAYESVEKLLAETKPEFVVSATPVKATPEVLDHLTDGGAAVLAEVPPAGSVEQLRDVYQMLTQRRARVQFAEQYAFQPHVTAKLAFAQSGRLGEITQAQLSLAHGYHGINVMRRFLGVRFAEARVSGWQFASPLVKGATRAGPPQAEQVKTSVQKWIRFDYGKKLGWIDFTSDQYMNPIRGRRMLIRGERGEMENDRVRYLKDYQTPIELELVRHAAGIDGNLEGNYLKGIQIGEQWTYRNPFAPAPLNDDEIAVATCLVRMGEYVRGGDPFYTPAQACHDQYLSLLAAEAMEKEQSLSTEPQPWSQ